MKYLPVDGYCFVDQFNLRWLKMELLNNKGKNLLASDPQGYLFEVTLSYPSNLHDLHSQFPILPVNREVFDDEISHMSYFLLNGKKRLRAPKLIADFNKREKYVVHYVQLKKALELGLILEEVHSAIQFNQRPFLSPYIEECLQKRNNATNSFEKNFYKLKVR